MISGKGLFLKKIGCSVLQGQKGRIFVIEMVLFIIIFCLPAGQTGFWAAPGGGQAVPDKVQAGEILRFHVRAHSNAPQDQEIKNYVARKILARFQPVWGCCHDSSELGRLLMQTKPEIAGAARAALQEKGFDHDVAVSLTHDLFPARFYEGQLYPPGEYTALYLVIGEGCGENWWCVLFPPLCFNLLPPLAAADAETGLQENGQQ
jgi:stage II sporulation protein R